MQNLILPTALWRGQRCFCFPREKTGDSRCHYKAAAERQADPARTHLQLVLFSQHLEGWSCLSLFFTGLEGLSQKSHLGNSGEDKERPAQGHPYQSHLGFIDRWPLVTMPTRNSGEDQCPVTFPGSLDTCGLSIYLFYVICFLTRLTVKGWSGFLGSHIFFFLIHRMVLQEEIRGF